MSYEAIGANVRRIRKAKGLSQKSLAESAELSVAGLRNIESRRSVPRVDTLTAISAALEVPLQALVAPVPELRAVRFRSFKSLKTREQILVDVGRWLKDFNELEEMLGDREDYPAELSNLESESRDPVRAASRVRELFRLRPDEPVRDICGLLESKGVKVLSVDVASDAFFGLSVAAEDGGPAIVVNTWDRISVERQIFTAAHELGHLVLHLSDYQVDQREEAEEQEREANLFAGHFLMPDEAFQREWGDTYGMGLVDRVLKVKRMFRVSYGTVLYRLSEDLEDKAALWKGFQVQHKRRFRKGLMKRDEPNALASDAFRASSPEALRAGEPERLSSADFVQDRLYRLVRKAVEESAITLSRGSEVLGMSLQEMRDLSASWVG
jgi:Zn-dependent peptidase ImmA (M78 family)/DNA-binding XRE family transcriptional regulator